MSDCLIGNLGKGRIYLIRRPVPGYKGILGLYAALTSGEFGFKWDEKSEVTVVMLNKRRTRLRILHADRLGFDLTVRIIYMGRFQSFFLEEPQEAQTIIPRELLMRLILDGTVDGETNYKPIQSIIDANANTSLSRVESMHEYI